MINKDKVTYEPVCRTGVVANSTAEPWWQSTSMYTKQKK